MANALLTAIDKAAKQKKKPEVHRVPAQKQPKGSNGMAEPANYYYPPTLYLSTNDFPGVSSWKAGDTVHLAITAKVKGVNINEHAGDKKKHHNADLELTQITDVTPKAGGK